MGVVLHDSIFFMLYMHSLRICFGCLDGKFFFFRLVVSIIFGSLVPKTERQNSDKHIYDLKEDKKKKLELARPTVKIGTKSSCKIFCSNILPMNMTFLRLTLNFFSLQLTDICKKSLHIVPQN